MIAERSKEKLSLHRNQKRVVIGRAIFDMAVCENASYTVVVNRHACYIPYLCVTLIINVNIYQMSGVKFFWNRQIVSKFCQTQDNKHFSKWSEPRIWVF